MPILHGLPPTGDSLCPDGPIPGVVAAALIAAMLSLESDQVK